ALATTLYHIAQKSIVPGVHPMVSLVITYATSLVACLVVVPFAPGGTTFARSLKDLNWATYVVGLSIVGVELAILLAYRAGWRIFPLGPSCGSRSKQSLSSPLYVARYTAVPAATMRARVAASSAAVTVGLVPRPSSGSAGSVARSTSWVLAPRAASRPSAYSTSRRVLDVADGLPEIPTAARPLVASLTPPRSCSPAGRASPWRRRPCVATLWRRDATCPRPPSLAAVAERPRARGSEPRPARGRPVFRLDRIRD